MPTHPPTRTTHRHRYLDIVTQARFAVIEAGVADLTRFRTHRSRTTNARPAPRRGDYNTLGLLTVTACLLLSGETDTTANAMRAIWSRNGLTDGDMTFIGLGDLRHTNDRWNKINSNSAAWNSEHRRLDDLRRGLHVRRNALRHSLLEPEADPSAD